MANPLGNLNQREAVIMFKKKFHKKVMLPTYIPFVTTDTGASLDEIPKTLTISYHNKNSKSTLIVTIMINIQPKNVLPPLPMSNVKDFIVLAHVMGN
ncbi:hypothetical protein J2T20_001129 [Paenibacillus wynnii]|nr:hypothetical protein [Paenibacillus wynnii]